MNKMKLQKNYNKIVVTLGGYVTVWLDNYNDGCISDVVNEWEIGETILVYDKINKSTLKEIRNELLKKLNYNLYSSIGLRKFKKDISIIDNRVIYSQYTNEENTYYPTKSDKMLFKRGKKDLYVQDVNITITINGEPLTENDLNTIIEL